MKTNFYINNKRITEPNNWKELSIELNFDKDSPNASVNINDWELGVGGYDPNKDGANLTNAHINNGLSGGVGVGEGAPFRIELENGGSIDEIFKGYLDLWESSIDCQLVTATAVEQGKVDWLNSVADSVSFEYLYDNGKITNNDFISIPYVINSIPNGGQVFLLSLTSFVSIQAIKKEISDLKKDLTDANNPITGVSAITKVALQIIYIGTLIVSVVSLILQAVRLIIQPVKYHKGMYLGDLARKGAEHFGLTFESSILDKPPFNKALILPQKNAQNVDPDDGLLGFLKPNPAQVGYFSGTYGGFLRLLKTMFNGKVILDNNVLRFERRDYNLSTPAYELPKIERGFYKLNKDDFKSNLFIEFATDLNDKNTIQEYIGTTLQTQTSFKTFNNRDMVLLSGLERISIPLALGKRKTKLTAPETVIKVLGFIFDPLIGGVIKLINGIIKVINALIKGIKKLIKAINTLPKVNIKFDPEPIKGITYTPLADLIENRKGMLKMENDFIVTPKIILANKNNEPRNNKLLADNESALNSLYLYNNFYYIDSFDGAIYPQTNQYKIYEVDNVPFCFDDYTKVKANNKILDDGKEGVIDSLTWNIWQQTANIKYRINEKYTNNLETDIITSKTGNPLI